MKYELNGGKETQANEKGEYSANITMGIRCTDGIVPDFSKDITTISNNSQTGYEVDEQRKKEIENFINEINK